MEGNRYRLLHALYRGFRHINSLDHPIYSNIFGILTSFTVKKQKLREVD